jgi:hypothetical protein
MPAVVPAHRSVHFPSVPRETESTSTSPQIRSGSSTIFYIPTPDGAQFSYFLDNKVFQKINKKFKSFYYDDQDYFSGHSGQIKIIKIRFVL